MNNLDILKFFVETDYKSFMEERGIQPIFDLDGYVKLTTEIKYVERFIMSIHQFLEALEGSYFPEFPDLFRFDESPPESLPQ